MEKYYSPDDVAGILQVSRRTAYAIMHDMQHMERPFRVAESALLAWIRESSTGPDGRKASRKGKKKDPVWGLKMPGNEDWRIPRRREAKEA